MEKIAKMYIKKPWWTNLNVPRFPTVMIVDCIFIGKPRFFKKPCCPAACVAENFRFGKVECVPRTDAVCYPERRLNIAVPYCQSMLLKSGGELPVCFLLPCEITGTVLGLGSEDDPGLLTRIGPVFDSYQLTA